MIVLEDVPKDVLVQKMLLQNLNTDNSDYKISCTKIVDYYRKRSYNTTGTEKALLPELIKITKLTQSAIKMLHSLNLVHDTRIAIENTIRDNNVYYITPTKLRVFLYNISKPVTLYTPPRARSKWPYIPISNVKIPIEKLLPDDIDYLLKVWLYLQNTNCTQAQQELKENCYNALKEINFKIPKPLQGLIHDFT